MNIEDPAFCNQNIEVPVHRSQDTGVTVNAQE
jgi:hypothetical protein